MYRLPSAAVLAVIVAGVTGPAGAQVTVRAGGAVLIERDVLGSLPGQTWNRKSKGDDVYQNEFIRTAMASKALIGFIDRTLLELGPAVIFKIDSVAFNLNRSVRGLTLSAEAGAIRWISGDSTTAHQFLTPTAVITPEGTTFDVFVQAQRTTVVLQEGRIRVCTIEAPQRCKTLSERGEMIIVTPGVLDGPRQGGPGPSEFADRCLSAASRNCVIGRLDPPPQPPRRSDGTKRHAYKVQSDDARSRDRGVVYEQVVQRRRRVRYQEVVSRPPRVVYPRPSYGRIYVMRNGPSYRPRPLGSAGTFTYRPRLPARPGRCYRCRRY
jgi:hypothetical protein